MCMVHGTLGNSYIICMIILASTMLELQGDLRGNQWNGNSEKVFIIKDFCFLFI